MKKLFLAISLMFAATASAKSLTTDYAFSNDSNHVNTEVVGAGYLWDYKGPKKVMGVVGRSLHSYGPGWSAYGDQVGFIYKDADQNGWFISELDATTLQSHTDATGFFSKGWIFENRNVEVFAEREFILDNENAVNTGIITTNAGVAGDMRVNDFTVGAYTSAQYFSDNNARLHARLTGGYVLLDAESYVELQARYRYYQDSNPYSVNYYSPDNFQELLFGVLSRTNVNNWIISGWAGYGPQRIDGDAKNAYAMNLRVASPKTVDGIFISVDAGYRNDEARGDGYKYGYGRITLNVPF